MPNTLYDNARKLFLEAGIHWINDDFRVLLVDLGTYTFQNTHQYVQAIPNEARIGPVTGVALGTNLTRTTDGGAADAPDVTFPSVSGPSIEAIVIYKDTGGVESTSPLIAFMDTATGLPITPNGGDKLDVAFYRMAA